MTYLFLSVGKMVPGVPAGRGRGGGPLSDFSPVATAWTSASVHRPQPWTVGRAGKRREPCGPWGGCLGWVIFGSSSSTPGQIGTHVFASKAQLFLDFDERALGNPPQPEPAANR